jgi:hypothetical protein
VRYIIKEYGARPSEEYGDRKLRFDEKSGITTVDMRHLVNDLLRDHNLQPVGGSYLDRETNETLRHHLQRIHRLLAESLDLGFPPLVSVRSFYANHSGNEFKWDALDGHWITLVEIAPVLTTNELGFRFAYADAATGRIDYGYAYVDEARNFAAAKGNAEKAEWLPDRPFLLLTAPSLRLGTQTVRWSDRTTIILNSAVYREEKTHIVEKKKQDPIQKPVLTQTAIGERASGPCALVNCFRWGDAKLGALIDRVPGRTDHDRAHHIIKKYGGRPSEENGDGKLRYDEKMGSSWVDMCYLVNDLLRDHDLKAVQGNYLDRGKDEGLRRHLQRVHRLLAQSLDAGFPPIVSVRAFYAKDYGNEFKWDSLEVHWVTLVEIAPVLAANEMGFRFGYADSATGRIDYGYAYVDEARNFAAAKGNFAKGEWLDNRPFVVVTAPSLRLLTEAVPWSSRTTIILNHAIYLDRE